MKRGIGTFGFFVIVVVSAVAFIILLLYFTQMIKLAPPSPSVGAIPLIPVCTPASLDKVRNNLSLSYIQTCDIDLTGYRFKPIGGNQIYGQGFNSFNGTYDGNGYTIYNFSYANDSLHNVGLFGAIKRPVVLKNIKLENCNVRGRRYVGALVGENSGINGKGGSIVNAHVSNCVVSSVFVGSSIGGLVGSNVGGNITHSSFSGYVYGIDVVGGLVGEHYSGLGSNPYSIISESSATANISGRYAVGGLVGSMSEADVIKSWSDVNVQASNNVGGLVGEFDRYGVILDSYSRGGVRGVTNVGGLVGRSSGAGENLSISQSYSATSVRYDYVGGGFFGFPDQAPVIVTSYWDINVSGQLFSYGGEGRTTQEMTSVPRPNNTYVNWDFNTIWEQRNGEYPWLRWQGY